MAAKNVLFIVGSLREGSFNRKLADVGAAALEGHAEVSFLDYADVPFMNQDIEFPPPAAVTRVRERVMAADAVWVCSPEHNHNVPAQLKNLLDWLSRPLVAGDYQTPRPLTGKPIAISGAGGRAGAAGGRELVEQAVKMQGGTPIAGAGEGFVLPPSAWATGVYEPSAEEQQRLQAQAEALLAAL